LKSDRAYLLHIRDSIVRIDRYASLGRDAFESDSMVQDAVIRNLEVIGEAVKSLEPSFREQHPEIPWSSIAGMRDRLIHHYFQVDLELVWNVIVKHLPALREVVNRVTTGTD
jgi:uncharacterized protein with HEPN domain